MENDTFVYNGKTFSLREHPMEQFLEEHPLFGVDCREETVTLSLDHFQKLIKCYERVQAAEVAIEEMCGDTLVIMPCVQGGKRVYTIEVMADYDNMRKPEDAILLSANPSTLMDALAAIAGSPESSSEEEGYTFFIRESKKFYMDGKKLMKTHEVYQALEYCDLTVEDVEIWYYTNSKTFRVDDFDTEYEKKYEAFQR